MKYEDLIRERITQLRLERNLSEYQLSYELGQSKGYIQGITSGRAMPSMTMFLDICDYFDITPSEFFDDKLPNLDVRNLCEKLSALDKQDFVLAQSVIDRLYSDTENNVRDNTK